MKIDDLAESLDFVWHRMANLSKNTSFIARITHLVKQHAKIAVAAEVNFYVQSVARVIQKEQVTLPFYLSCVPQIRHALCQKKEKEAQEEKHFFTFQIFQVGQIDVPEMSIHQRSFH